MFVIICAEYLIYFITWLKLISLCLLYFVIVIYAI